MSPVVVQPGPPAALRIESASGRLRTIDLTAVPGLTLVEAVAGKLAEAGISGGAVDLAGLHLGPFEWVMPAPSPDADHVAYYSQTYRAAGTVAIESGTATFGQRDGAPFLHAHALWRDGERRGAGHILPLDSRVAASAQLRAWGVAEAAMVATPDAETNFTLFGPVQLGPAPPDSDGVLGRLRPGVDLVDGIEALCRRHGITRATIRSGVGSTVGSRMEHGALVETIPTEFFIRHGTVQPDRSGHPRAEIELVLVDEAGAIHAGRPTRALNKILICAEIVLSAG